MLASSLEGVMVRSGEGVRRTRLRKSNLDPYAVGCLGIVCSCAIGFLLGRATDAKKDNNLVSGSVADSKQLEPVAHGAHSVSDVIAARLFELAKGEELDFLKKMFVIGQARTFDPSSTKELIATLNYCVNQAVKISPLSPCERLAALAVGYDSFVDINDPRLKLTGVELSDSSDFQHQSNGPLLGIRSAVEFGVDIRSALGRVELHAQQSVYDIDVWPRNLFPSLHELEVGSSELQYKFKLGIRATLNLSFFCSCDIIDVCWDSFFGRRLIGMGLALSYYNTHNQGREFFLYKVSSPEVFDREIVPKLITIAKNLDNDFRLRLQALKLIISGAFEPRKFVDEYVKIVDSLLNDEKLLQYQKLEVFEMLYALLPSKIFDNSFISHLVSFALSGSSEFWEGLRSTLISAVSEIKRACNPNTELPEDSVDVAALQQEVLQLVDEQFNQKIFPVLSEIGSRPTSEPFLFGMLLYQSKRTPLYEKLKRALPGNLTNNQLRVVQALFLWLQTKHLSQPMFKEIYTRARFELS